MSAGHTQIITVVMAAGDVRQVLAEGVNFELVQTTTPVDVSLSTRDGAEVAGMKQAEAGYFINGRKFSTVQITSALPQTVKFFVGSADAGSRRITGSLVIGSQTPPQFGAATNNTVAVANVASTLLNANPLRKYVLVMNKSLTGTIWVSVTAVATQANGIRIGPGEMWEFAVQPTDTLGVIGDIANNPNVHVISG